MAETNPYSRLETFCDGVFAIAMTLLIIDIKIPATAEINSTTEFWHVLGHMMPSILAFALSFLVILITWVNHHASLKLGSKTTASFLYANGLLLFSVIFMPFPTSLVGEYILTDHAAPAVILYNATLALQSIAWVILSRISLKHKLPKNEAAAKIVRVNGNYGYFAFVLYGIFALAAIWLPQVVAVITILTWIFWLILGVRLKHE